MNRTKKYYRRSGSPARHGRRDESPYSDERRYKSVKEDERRHRDSRSPVQDRSGRRTNDSKSPRSDDKGSGYSSSPRWHPFFSVCHHSLWFSVLDHVHTALKM